jgi:hypothetical protein
MPENVTGFQPTGNLKKSLIDLAYFDIWPRRSPTVFREEPKLVTNSNSLFVLENSLFFENNSLLRLEKFPCSDVQGMRL